MERNPMRLKRQKVDWAILAVAVISAVIAMGVVAGANPESEDSPRLVGVQHLPDQINTCEWDGSAGTDPKLLESLEQNKLFSALRQQPPPTADGTSAPPTLLASLQQEPSSPQTDAAPPRQRGGQRADDGEITAADRSVTFVLPNTEEQERETAELRAHGARLPVRTIRDTTPTYSAVAVDVNSDEVILQDNNLWSYRVFDRLSPTPKGDNDISTPKRIVQGDKTALQFNNGLYVDPQSGDIYSVESDVGDKMVRFPREAHGDISPTSILHTPHRVYNIAADEVKQEFFVTVEYPPQVVVYRKNAVGEEKPLRAITGDDTGLDAPHGIAVDEKDRLLFVNTWGHHSNYKVQGTGKFFPPAIKVYALDSNGDAKPLRVITGDSTQLDWPAAMKYNPDNGDLYVANDIGASVLVFANAAKVEGDIAPARVIKGPSTRLRNPTGVAIDRKNQELWVSNLGNSSATVYPLMADGDVPPLRIIRSAEESKRGLDFGRTAAVTYDPNRQEILVPNCVNHPQIAVFARSATENTPYLRSIEGQKTLLGRTMHDLAFDAVHDEIVVTSPLAQGILTFRGAANGEEPPLRVIQGDKTHILGVGATAKVTVDAVHGEIYLPTPDQAILVFDRLANGNTAPIRIISGKDTQLALGVQTNGSGQGPPIRVDPIHNLILAPTFGRAANGGGRILIFDRMANGNTPPKAIIKGPVGMGNQFEVFGRNLITHTGNDLEIWRIPETGESDERPLKIPAPLGRHSFDLGMALDPLHKEVIISSSAGNAILTFFVPELYEDKDLASGQ